jgi:rhodanese-related sulfurtransferase
MLHRSVQITGLGALFATGLLLAVTPRAVEAETPKPAVSASELPKMKQTKLGLYVTAAEAYEMWKANPDKVKVIDVRTPEEFAFVGHPEMAWNIPVAFVTYEGKGGKFTYGHRMNSAFVAQVREIAQPGDTLLLMCRSGGRGAMAVNQLAAAGFTNAYNIVDGMEGDAVDDPESVFNGKRMKNGWKNSAPWGYGLDPEKMILEEGGASKGFTKQP